MLNEPNKLINEVSPYLLQHSYNPVKWHTWNNETLEKAKRENKLLLISIGYSSYHWCHVMEKESFMDNDIAQIMSQNYICVKVDREERPDIDQIYMNAVQIITRKGGWPLNCFALPDGRPVYGGTYFPKDQWKSIIESMNETWIHEPQKVIEVAEELEHGIVSSEIIHDKTPIESEDLKQSLTESIHSIKSRLDYTKGGTIGAPKFPMPGFIKLLLEYGNHSHDSEIKEYVNTTLLKIANGGIYDHVGGGFYRYSVDEKWHIPHFEKMLYDNAQLIEVYSLAFRRDPNPLFKKIVDETIEFTARELLAPNGGFYSALDADCNGLEGEYYTWKKNDLESILEYDSELFCSAYGIALKGNWNNTNVLRRCITDSQLESIFNIPSKEIEYRLSRSLLKMRNERGKRVPPLIDDKIITSWNGLMVSALSQAYISFGNKRYLELALSANENIEKTHFTNGNLQRIQCKGKVYTEPLLDDYANYIKSLINLYNATLNHEWLNKANSLATKTIDNFWDSSSGMFFYTSNSNKLIARKMELIDGVMPSANAVMAGNLIHLSELLEIQKYRKIANQMLANISYNIKNNGTFVYAWVNLFLSQSLPMVHLGFSKELANDIQKIQSQIVYSNTRLSLNSNVTDKIQVCIGTSCQQAQNNIEPIVNQINQIKIE
ncbi:MAG: thioredoxin domain-containing protein [Bacteroidales bacterium]